MDPMQMNPLPSVGLWLGGLGWLMLVTTHLWIVGVARRAVPPFWAFVLVGLVHTPFFGFGLSLHWLNRYTPPDELLGFPDAVRLALYGFNTAILFTLLLIVRCTSSGPRVAHWLANWFFGYRRVSPQTIRPWGLGSLFGLLETEELLRSEQRRQTLNVPKQSQGLAATVWEVNDLGMALAIAILLLGASILLNLIGLAGLGLVMSGIHPPSSQQQIGLFVRTIAIVLFTVVYIWLFLCVGKTRSC